MSPLKKGPFFVPFFFVWGGRRGAFPETATSFPKDETMTDRISVPDKLWHFRCGGDRHKKAVGKGDLPGFSGDKNGLGWRNRMG